MARIVFIGGFTPMQKVLHAIGDSSGLEFDTLYTDVRDNATNIKIARKLGMDVIDILDLTTTAGVDHLRARAPDWLLNVNSTLVLSTDILQTAQCGCLNLHPGQLPEYAGLHTHQWAIRNDEPSCATTLHWMKEGIDTGDIAYMREILIGPRDTGLSLFMKCMKSGAELVIKALDDIAVGVEPPKTAQDLTRRKLYTNEHARCGSIRWEWSSRQIYNFVRAADYHPFDSPTYVPTATLIDGREISILKAELVADPNLEVGQVSSSDSRGVIVGAGDRQGVLITKIRDHNQAVVKGAAITEVIGVNSDINSFAR